MVSYQCTTKEIPLRINILAWAICFLGALFYCYEYFLRISPSVMTSQLMSTYHLSGAEVGNLSAFYYYAYVPMQLIVGLLMDRYGPRRLLTIACFFCAIGTILFSNNTLFIAQFGRFLVGFGSAFAFVGALKLVTIWLPPHRFAFVSGVISCAGMFGAMVGDILLRRLVDALGWQMTIYSSAIFGIVLMAIVWLLVRDKNRFQENSHHHLLTTTELFMNLLKIVTNVQFWLNGLIGLLTYLFLSAFAELWAIPYLTQGQHLLKSQASISTSLIFFGWAIGSVFWGWFSDLIGLRRTPIIWATVAALILSCILFYNGTFSYFAINLILLGIGIFSSVEVLVFPICREITHIKMTGTAVSLTNAVVMLGGSLLQPMIGKILDLFWTGDMLDGARIYSTHAYQIALSVLPISLAITLFIMLFIKETHCQIKTNHA